MRTLIISSSYLSHTSVCCQNNNRCLLILQGSVKKAKALNIQHVNLIYEKHSWNYISFIFLLPQSNFLINLISYFLPDFSSLSWEQSHKALGSGVNHINVMQADCMNHLFFLHNFSFGTLSKSCLWRHCIILACFGKTSALLGNLARPLVNRNYISSSDFLIHKTFDHLWAKIIYRLHVSGLESKLSSSLIVGSLLNINMNNLSLNDLRFFFYSHCNWSSKSLCKTFCLAHFKRENLRAWNHVERCLLS